MLELYVMRHAESVANKKAEFIGGRQNDIPLSSLGELQADRLGDCFVQEGIQFDEAYASTAVRAIQTAERSLKKSGFPLERIVKSAAFLELDQGEWEKMPRDQIYTPEIIALMRADNLNFRAPGGESQKEVAERVYGEIEEKMLPYYKEGRRIGVYMHGFAIKSLLRKVLDSDPRLTYRIQISNASITRLGYNKDGWCILSVNETGHLGSLKNGN